MPRTPATVIDPLVAISDNLQPRDYVLAHLLDEHDILSLEQIKKLFFPSPRTCRRRLNELQRLRFVAGFTQVRGDGSRPRFFLPGLLSTRYTCLTKHEPEPTHEELQDRQARSAFHRDRHDTIGANEFFVDLFAHSRTNPATSLARWWSPSLTRIALQGLAWPEGHGLQPDGHGVWIEDGHEVRFFLEYDTGAGPISDLMEQLANYRHLREDGGPDYPVLIWLPTTEREAELHAELQRARRWSSPAALTVATAVRNTGAGPATAAWWVSRVGLAGQATAGGRQDRCRLRDLHSEAPRVDWVGPRYQDPDQVNLREPDARWNTGRMARTLLDPLTRQQHPMYLPPWRS
jgi:hypothetical protein